MNKIEAFRVFNEFQRLLTLISDSEAGQEARWKGFQDWLKKNPQQQARVDACLTMTPGDAVTYLCADLGLEQTVLTLFDPMGQLRGKAEEGIRQLQTIYKSKQGVRNEIQSGSSEDGAGADHAAGDDRKRNDHARNGRTNHRRK